MKEAGHSKSNTVCRMQGGKCLLEEESDERCFKIRSDGCITVNAFSLKKHWIPKTIRFVGWSLDTCYTLKGLTLWYMNYMSIKLL